jgi:hypothetical protein
MSKVNNTVRVLECLFEGRSFTAAQAKTRFGVKNFRSLISSIKKMGDSYGFYSITTTKNSSGFTSYSMNITKKGLRAYRAHTSNRTMNTASNMAMSAR